MDPEADDHLSPQQQFLIVYYGGFFLLPWLWFINFLFWFEYIKGRRDASAESRTYALKSLVFFLLSAAIFFPWFITYQVEWRSWGLGADPLAVNIPNGPPT